MVECESSESAMVAQSLVMATLVSAPRQRNTDAEKARIKQGEKARDIWPDKPAKARQKDTDARWTVKLGKASTSSPVASRARSSCFITGDAVSLNTA